MIVVRNERDALVHSLRSLMEQDLPWDQYEILVVDGCSTDGTVEEVRRMEHENPQRTVRVLVNPRLSLAAGWNIGIAEARGEFVVRIDAHASVPPDFLRANLALHEEREVVCTGGPMTTQGFGYWGEVIAAALSSRFGVGSSFRTLKGHEGHVDTVAFGMYRRLALIDVGPFSESMDRNQDIELHRRLKERGGRVYMSPRIHSTYHSRSSVPKMLTQAFGNGYWHAAALRAMSPRHAAPAMAVLAGATLVLLGLLGAKWAWIVLGVAVGLHLILGTLASLSASVGRRTQQLCMPGLFLLLHVTYGIGTWAGVVSRGLRALGALRRRSAVPTPDDGTSSVG